MTEGGIADRELAALALKQASGDNVEAIFLLRAYRTTLAKLAVSGENGGNAFRAPYFCGVQRYSGGQLLGPTYDYTHRLLDFTLLANGETPQLSVSDAEQDASPHVFSLLANRGWRRRKRTPAAHRMTSPARRRFIPVRARPACNS